MAQKRPFDDGVVNEFSSKHPRQHGPGAEIISHNDRLYQEADIVKHSDSGIVKGEIESHDDCDSGSCPEIFREGVEETDSDAPRSASLSHWATSCTSDEDSPQEEMAHVPFYSGYFSFDRPVRLAINPEDVYHCLLDYPPRKRVPVGPDYQAEIPPLGESTSKENFDENVMNFSGTCIIPNLDTQPLAHDTLKVGVGRTDCRCQDQGSIKCVQLHIIEARVTLRKVLGHDTFMELGFNNMGEVVADRWTDEEEQLFLKVVYSNPVSLGRNFWNVLSDVFPSRTIMEIVCYYFNVFMLRKRAEQNRCDSMSVDSDNDEWQGSDSDEDDEDEVSNNEDSGIESPTRHDTLMHHQNGLHIDDNKEDGEDVLDDAQASNEKNGEGLIRKYNADSGFEFSGKMCEDGGENDTQDGSCTSSDSGPPVQGTRIIKSDTSNSHDWHDYIDAKAWDGYVSCPKSNVDFLPTCSMIEEVFGGEFDSKDKSR